jgi:hypothetical protein
MEEGRGLLPGHLAASHREIALGDRLARAPSPARKTGIRSSWAESSDRFEFILTPAAETKSSTGLMLLFIWASKAQSSKKGRRESRRITNFDISRNTLPSVRLAGSSSGRRVVSAAPQA